MDIVQVSMYKGINNCKIKHMKWDKENSKCRLAYGDILFMDGLLFKVTTPVTTTTKPNFYKVTVKQIKRTEKYEHYLKN